MSDKEAKSLLKLLEAALPGAPKQEGHLRQLQTLRVAPQDLLCHGRGLSRNRDTLHLGGETTFNTGAAWATWNSAFKSFHQGLEAECQVKDEGSALEAMEILRMAKLQGCKTSPECSQETRVSQFTEETRREDRQTQTQGPGPPTGGFCQGVEALTGQVFTATLSSVFTLWTH